MKIKNIAILITVLVVLDQILKVWVKTSMALDESIEIFPWFHLHFVENNGAAFGMQINTSGAVGWGLSVTVLILCFLLDYILAFSALGLAGVFGNCGFKRQVSGIFLACLIRFACHYISGVTIWSSGALDAGFANPYLYSLLYNGAYMLPETVFTCIGAVILLRKFNTKA